LLDRLPSLQALIVSNLSFFDHQALQTIHQRKGSLIQDDTKYNLRLLIASSCENTTAASLATALVHFPELVYLDLSCTQGSRSPSVLQKIGMLARLRVLKLRNCGLRDYDIDLLTLSPRLRSLDLSDNSLTQNGIASLIKRLPAAHQPFIDHENSPSKESLSLDSRQYSRRAGSSRRSILQSFVAAKLTSGLDGYLYIEDSLPKTFADLYL
jgi:hypothetical protein